MNNKDVQKRIKVVEDILGGKVTETEMNILKSCILLAYMDGKDEMWNKMTGNKHKNIFQ